MRKKTNPTTKFKVDISELKSGIIEANRHIKLANAEFREASAGMDDWSKSSEGLEAKLKQLNKVYDAQKSKLQSYEKQKEKLNEAYEENEKRAEQLRKALQDLANKGVSETSEEYKKLKKTLGEVISEQASNKKNAERMEVTILNQKAAVKKVEKEIKNYKNSLESLSNEANQAEGANKALSKSNEDVGDSAKEAGKDSKNFAENLKSLFTCVKVTAAGIGALIAQIVNCAEASEEYRREMGKLDTAFTTANHSSEAAKTTYKELQSILGETDQAVEAANHLALLGDNEKDLSKMTNALIGVYGTFGASLPLEALTEAANETAKVGQVTGNFADAINWVKTKSDDWRVALNGNKKALTAFEKAVKNGESAEDAYNAALATCSDEQERQKLIVQTLTQLYGKAAKQYKKTNAEVIRSNKANEEWNETIAEIGESVAPVITDLKELGNALVKEAAEPIEDITKQIRSEALPALADMGEWIVDNKDVITSTFKGGAAAVVTYKAAVIAAEIGQKGFLKTLEATTVAQKAMNLASAATPWGLAATAIIGVITALIAYGVKMNEASINVQHLTDDELDYIEAAQTTIKTLEEQRAATEENVGSIQSQMKHIKDLSKELKTLADSSGKVKDSDKARAQFILGELNKALGTEYTMTDGVIQKYDELKASIEDVIAAKTANSLLEAHNENYIAAIEAEDELLRNLILTEKDYQAQLSITQEVEREATEARAAFQQKVADAKEAADYRKLASEGRAIARMEESAKIESKLLEEKKSAYNDAATAYGENATEIMNYEEAQQEVLEGNYTRAVDVLKAKSQAFGDYADDVDAATAEALDALYKEAVNAGIEAERTKKNFEKGVKGYTKKMVDEAEQGYKDACNAYADAYIDAENVGNDIGDGLADGMEERRIKVVSKIKSLVKSIISGARDEADCHSPSRKMIAVTEDIGDGAVVGLKNKTKAILSVARSQMKGILSEYQSGSSASAVQNISKRIGSVAGVPSAGTVNNHTTSTVNNFYQTNNSPKELSRLDIYRQTHNLLNMKG